MNNHLENIKNEPGSVIAAVINFVQSPNKLFGDGLLFVEALILTLISVYAVRLIGVPEPGLIGIVLASAAMTPRLNQILELNRARIWSGEGNGRRVNLASMISGLSLFSGMFVAFMAIGIASSDAVLIKDFNFIVTRIQLDTNTVLSPERFSQGVSIFQHNLSVLITLALMSFVYRSLGAMFALGWNAGVWGVTIVLFMGGGRDTELNTVVYGTMILIAIIPHLIVEAASYLIGALAAIFLSRGLTIYRLNDTRLNRVMSAVGVLAILSVGLLVSGALLENYFPRLVLESI
ncbi:MAG: stage II sporulation protein M [Chloroflexota bacterium]|nr:stage II sporulation protein M [Chloroflexota bacterium]